MNTDTNMLYKDIDKAKLAGELMKDLTPVPQDLKHAANVALKGNDSVRVSKNSGGRLSSWAKLMRYQSGYSTRNKRGLKKYSKKK